MRWNLIARRQSWCLTWRGWACAVAVLAVLLFVGINYTAPFLSTDQPIAAEILIVEGWLPDYALKDSAEEFKHGKYRYVITAGGPLLEGYYISHARTSADLAASTLIALGLPRDSVVAVPAPGVLRDRTLAHAQAVRSWIQVNDPNVRSVNVYSLGVHARRTWLVFEKVLGGKVKVGVIAHPDASYDSTNWLNSSEGFRTVTEEALAYLWYRMCGRI